MTSTSKQPAKGNPQGASKDEEWDDAPKISAGDERPSWNPQWQMLNADALKQKMTTVTEGSTADATVIGELRVEHAFGEPRYFVYRDDGKPLAMPLHGVLTSALDRIRLDPAPRVRIDYKGEARRARPGQRAAFLYDLRVKPGDALLAAPRDGEEKGKDGKPIHAFPALLPIHRENKKKQQAAKNGAPDYNEPDTDD